MDNEIYRKHISKAIKNTEDGLGSFEVNSWLVLTDEVNRLIVWDITADFDDETVTFVKAFKKWQRSDAIDFAVNTASEAIIDALPEGGTAP